MSTPRLGLTEISSSQSQKEVTLNDALRAIEQGVTRFVVKDKDLTTPPGSPAEGDAYFIPNGGLTGAWVGHGNSIAFYQNAAWEFISPLNGWRVFVEDEALEYTYRTGSPGPMVPDSTSMTSHLAASDPHPQYLLESAVSGFMITVLDDATAGAALTTLGGTTVGQSLFTLANPGAITFPRLNADNTVTARSAADLRTDLGGTTVGQSLFTLANPGAITFPRLNADNTVTARSAADIRTDMGVGAADSVTFGGVTASTLTASGNINAAAWTTAGIALKSVASTYTDTTSPAGPVTAIAVHGMAVSTVASTNAITVADLSTLYIAGAPTAGTNVTATASRALHVAAGGALIVGSATFRGTVSLNVSQNNQTNINTGTTTSAVSIGGASCAVNISSVAGGTLGFHGATATAQRASAAQAAVATTGATNVTPYGFTTAAQADAIVTLCNELRAAVVEKGLIKGSA